MILWTRKTKFRWLLLALLCGLSLTFVSVAYGPDLYGGIDEVTRGALHRTLLSGLVQLSVCVLLVLMVGGRLRRQDIGLDVSNIAPAFLATAGLWVAAQIVLATAAWLETNDVALASTWQESGAAVRSLGFLAGMLLGTVLYEEVFYRGVLLPQCYLILRGNRIVRLAGALLISQTLFAFLHLPSLVLWYELDTAELLARLFYLFGAGCFFALMYFRTVNLLAVVGIHSLLNRPTSLVESPLNEVVVLLALSVVFGIVWPVVNGGRLRFQLPEIRLRPGAGGSPTGRSEEGEDFAAHPAPGLAQRGHGRG